MSRRLYARDMRGADAADLDGSARSSAVALAAPSPTTARHQPHVALMLGLQRTAGNQAVLGLLGMRSPRHALAPAHVAQRQDDDYEDAGSSWGGGEEMASSEYPSGESSGAGSEWSSGASDSGAGGGGGEGGESWGTSEAPATESSGGDYGSGSGWSEAGGAGGDELAGSEWSGGGGGGGSGGGASEGGGGGSEGGGAGGGESAGSEWSGGGESAGSEWSGGGGGEEASGDDDGGGSSWWPFGGGDEEPGEGEGEGGDEGDFSPEQIQEKLDEGEIGPVEDAAPSIRSSPIYTPPPGQIQAPSGFHDGGRSGTVPFGSADGDDDPNVPHAITIGGRAGSIAWSGGGKAGGPKGHPGTGVPSLKVEPKYDTAWNGPVAFASAWVMPGTGVFDVHRTYATSNAGDQGNGWWISSRAAAALEAHEVRHLESAKTVYGSRIQPLLDRIAKSKSVGYHTNYLASHAIAQLENYIRWKTSIEKFVEEDAQWNADGGQIDTEDYMSPGYPHNQNGPKTIAGKTYDKYLVMNDEEPPPP